MRLARHLEDEALTGAEANDPVLQLVDRAVGQLMALQQAAGTREPIGMAEALADFVGDLTARYEGRITTFMTDLRDIDRLTGGGGRRGELWVIGARPSMGKTAFVLQLCRRVGLRHQVLLCSQEDSILSASGRFVAAEGGVNLAHIRSPASAPEAMWDSVTEGVEALSGLNVMLDDQAGLTLADVRRKGQQVKRKCGRLDLLVVDYLQLMDDGGGMNRSQGLGFVANGLKALAKELGCWIVLLSQLSRKADERNGPPQMSDLRDSGDIEGAADLIGMLYRECMRKETEENKHWAQFHVPKQKNGPTGTANLHFDGARQRFSDWEGPVPAKRGGGNGAH
jgi:replicative DNA helicase